MRLINLPRLCFLVQHLQQGKIVIPTYLELDWTFCLPFFFVLLNLAIIQRNTLFIKLSFMIIFVNVTLYNLSMGVWDIRLTEYSKLYKTVFHFFLNFLISQPFLRMTIMFLANCGCGIPITLANCVWVI